MITRKNSQPSTICIEQYIGHVEWQLWISTFACFLLITLTNLSIQDHPFDEFEKLSDKDLTHLMLLIESNTVTLQYSSFEQLCFNNPNYFGTVYESFIHEIFMLFITLFLVILFTFIFIKLEQNNQIVSILNNITSNIYSLYIQSINKLSSSSKTSSNESNHDHSASIAAATKNWAKVHRIIPKFSKFCCIIIFHHCLYYILLILECWIEIKILNQFESADTNANSLNDSLNSYSNLYDDGSIGWYIRHFITIFRRVHPKNHWLIRISHGFSYPFIIFGLFRTKTSHMGYVFILMVITGVYYYGEFAHQYDNDIQLKCVRNAFITQTKQESIAINGLRRLIAPYINLLCLTTDCANFL